MNRAKPKVGFVSLGCPKALVDSERILTQLKVEGYEIVPSYAAADVVVVNTCGFIDAAVKESLDAICIIRSMRGDLVSRPVDDVLREAERLVRSGVRELLVISQDTSAYGVDVKYAARPWQGASVRTRMTELCAALGELGAWVRLHYVYPYPSVDEVLPLMAEGKVLPYLDVPFQHAHPDVLKRMKRPASGERNLDRIRAWRAICPELTIRSTFIAGFPGETEAQFDYLLDFLREAELDRVGCFAYSPVDGAQANALDGALPDDVREDRRARFMAVQEEISARRLRRHVGKLRRVLIDEVGADGGIARSDADAPEIDGNVLIAPPQSASGRLAWRQKVRVGSFATVRITGVDGHDLRADLA